MRTLHAHRLVRQFAALRGARTVRRRPPLVPAAGTATHRLERDLLPPQLLAQLGDRELQLTHAPLLRAERLERRIPRGHQVGVALSATLGEESTQLAHLLDEHVSRGAEGTDRAVREGKFIVRADQLPRQ